MTENILVFDTTTGRTKASTTPSTALNPSENWFTVSATTQTNFTISSGTLTASNRVQVFINGIYQKEGSVESYTRNVGLNRIEFVTPVIQGAVVLVLVY